MKFVCIFKTGGDYDINHVKALYHNVTKHLVIDEFVCYTNSEDLPYELPINFKPLIHNLPGKWSMIEAFREKGKVIVTGLDTVFLRNSDVFEEIAEQCKSNEFYVIRSFNSRRTYGNGIMVWNGDWMRLLTDYANHEAIIKGYQLEQEWTFWKLKKEKAVIKVLNDVVDGIYSYKKKYTKAKPKDSRVLVFHGKPRPHECKNPLIIKEYPYKRFKHL